MSCDAVNEQLPPLPRTLDMSHEVEYRAKDRICHRLIVRLSVGLVNQR